MAAPVCRPTWLSISTYPFIAHRYIPSRTLCTCLVGSHRHNHIASPTGFHSDFREMQGPTMQPGQSAEVGRPTLLSVFAMPRIGLSGAHFQCSMETATDEPPSPPQLRSRASPKPNTTITRPPFPHQQPTALLSPLSSPPLRLRRHFGSAA